MKAVEIADVAASLAQYAKGAEKQPVVLTLDGKPVAALVGLGSIDMETCAMSNDPRFLSIIEKSRARYKAEGGLTPAELRRRFKNGAKGTS